MRVKLRKTNNSISWLAASIFPLIDSLLLKLLEYLSLDWSASPHADAGDKGASAQTAQHNHAASKAVVPVEEQAFLVQEVALVRTVGIAELAVTEREAVKEPDEESQDRNTREIGRAHV